MKVYISGKITGLPYSEVQARFQSAEYLLEAIDLEPVNPLRNGLLPEHTWEEHMVKDIEMLFECDGILMLDNWESSDGAKIENYIAKTRSMIIMHERPLTEKKKMVAKLKSAIKEVTGMSFCDYTTKSRNRDAFFARMIFAKHCMCLMKPTEIAKMINRDRTTVHHMVKVYKDEVKFNPAFREIASKVEQKMISVEDEQA